MRIVGFNPTLELKHKRLKNQPLCCKYTANRTMLWFCRDKICWLVVTSPPIHLSAVCPPETNLTAPHRLPFLSVRPSTYLPVLPSFPGSADSSISPFFLSVRLSVRLSVLPWLCWQLLGLMPSQCSAPSWPLERCLHSLSRWTGNHSFSHFFFLKFSRPSKVYFTRSLTCRSTQSLFLWSVSISIPLHSWPSCCWEADRKKDWERQTDRKHTEPSLEGLCSESLPAKPKASQSVLPLLFMSPMLRLHLDSMPACDDVPSYMDKTAHDFQNTREAHRIRQS